MSPDSLKIRLRRTAREWLLPFAVMALILGSVRSSVADWNDVPSGSMRPTIFEGERIAVNRLAYDLKLPFTGLRLARWATPERGDIVILHSPVDGKRLVKRVVGLPGDQLAMQGGRLVINGQPLVYTALSADCWQEQLGGRVHRIRRDEGRPHLRDGGPLRVPAGHYFVMGDNRDNSADSRVFGCVAQDAIMGEVKAVVGSLDPQRHWLPRWERWFKRLS
ncbi:signal peptidase I [bacterium]|nr:signal peptidase I [bacterium]